MEDLRPPPQVENLFGDEIEKSVAAFDRDERFGPVQSHPRPQPTVQFNYRQLLQNVTFRCASFADGVQLWERRDRFDGAFGQQARLACHHLVNGTQKRRDGRATNSGGTHFGFEDRVQVVGIHQLGRVSATSTWRKVASSFAVE